MALPRQYRLRHRRDFDALYRKGRRFASAHLLVRVLRPAPVAIAPLENTHENTYPPRLGIVVSQKVSKRAVVRNRIRRQIQGVMQGFLPQIQPGLRLLITVKPPAVECDYYKFLQELRKLLSDAEVLDGYS
ncbi:MAG: ribonuclease P protein component [Prochlorothrix sp.]|nr:ribonuclease P protein component [Prochlorothrix sp.]